MVVAVLHAFMRSNTWRWALPLGVFLAIAGASPDASALDLAALRDEVKKDPSNPKAALALGRALRRGGELVEARSILSRGALVPSARSGGTFDALVHELALTQIDRNDMAGANAACTQLATAGSKALAGVCRAEVHMMRNRATDALPEVEQALTAEPSRYEAKVVKARILAFQQKFEEATKLAEEAARDAPLRPEAHFTLGLIQRGVGKVAAAVPHLAKAQGLDPDDAVIAVHLGEALGAGLGAKKAFEQAVAIRPSYAAAHAGLARVSVALGDLATAERAAEKAIALAPANYASVVALGQVRLVQKKWDEALKLGEKAQKLIPNQAAGELVVADAHAGKGDIDLAVEAYQKAFGLDREAPDALIRAARACRSAGRLTTARGFADRATTDFPKSGPAWAELGEVAIAQGEKAPARAAIQKAISLGGVDKTALEKRLSGLGG